MAIIACFSIVCNSLFWASPKMLCASVQQKNRFIKMESKKNEIEIERVRERQRETEREREWKRRETEENGRRRNI